MTDATLKDRPSDKRDIAVVYICDHNFHTLTECSLASFARMHAHALDFYFFQVGYELPITPALEDLVTARGHRVIVAQADFPFPEGARPGTGSKVKLLKAQAIEMLANSYERIQYIDGDILAFADVQLEDISRFDDLLAAVYDISDKVMQDRPTLGANGPELSSAYFNSGFFSVNAARWLKERALQRFLDLVAQHAEHCPYYKDCTLGDQCILNMLANGDWRRLPLTFNAQKSLLHTSVWADAKVRHYTGKQKFIPVQNRTCDARARKLLASIRKEAGLAIEIPPYDGGVMYSLNRIRRRREILHYQALSDAFSQQINAGH
ncbi:MAG: glycosyltransferase [Alphaproteobacteria bacterium]